MLTIPEILKKYGDQIIADIRQKMVQEDINASGALSDSLEQEIQENFANFRLFVTAYDYIFDVEEGKSPEQQRQIDFYELVSRYKKWIANKKIGLYAQFERAEDMAQAFVVKTRSEGTLTHRLERPTGILSETITEEFISNLSKEISDSILNGAIEIISRTQK